MFSVAYAHAVSDALFPSFLCNLLFWIAGHRIYSFAHWPVSLIAGIRIFLLSHWYIMAVYLYSANIQNLQVFFVEFGIWGSWKTISFQFYHEFMLSCIMVGTFSCVWIRHVVLMNGKDHGAFLFLPRSSTTMAEFSLGIYFVMILHHWFVFLYFITK